MNLDSSQRSSTFLRGLLLAAALCGLLVVQPATAQPGGRVVKMVVPYPAGGGEKLHKDVAEVLADPAFVQVTLNPQFLAAGKESRAEFKAVMEADNVRWADIIKKNNIKAE